MLLQQMLSPCRFLVKHPKPDAQFVIWEEEMNRYYDELLSRANMGRNNKIPQMGEVIQNISATSWILTLLLELDYFYAEGIAMHWGMLIQ